jgi:hypothetical protein
MVMFKTLKFVATAAIATLALQSAGAMAQDTVKATAAKPANEAPSRSSQKLGPEQKAYFSAVKKVFALKEYKDALNTGDAQRAKKILIENGASQDIILQISTPVWSNSEPFPVDTPNGGCTQWKLFTWWAPTPAPGHYYQTWQCVKWISEGVTLYDATQ